MLIRRVVYKHRWAEAAANDARTKNKVFHSRVDALSLIVGTRVRRVEEGEASIVLAVVPIFCPDVLIVVLRRLKKIFERYGRGPWRIIRNLFALGGVLYTREGHRLRRFGGRVADIQIGL